MLTGSAWFPRVWWFSFDIVSLVVRVVGFCQQVVVRKSAASCCRGRAAPHSALQPRGDFDFQPVLHNRRQNIGVGHKHHSDRARSLAAAPRWRFKIDATERREPRMNTLLKVAPGRAPRPRPRGLRNASRFRFYEVGLLAGSDMQPYPTAGARLRIVVLPIGLTSLYDFTLIVDCVDINRSLNRAESRGRRAHPISRFGCSTLKPALTQRAAPRQPASAHTR